MNSVVLLADGNLRVEGNPVTVGERVPVSEESLALLRSDRPVDPIVCDCETSWGSLFATLKLQHSADDPERQTHVYPVEGFSDIATGGLDRWVFTTKQFSERVPKNETWLEFRATTSGKLYGVEHTGEGTNRLGEIDLAGLEDRIRAHIEQNDWSILFSTFENTPVSALQPIIDVLAKDGRFTNRTDGRLTLETLPPLKKTAPSPE